MKISFSVSRIQGLSGAGHQKNHQKSKKIPQNPKNYPDRIDIRTGHPDRYTRGSRVGGGAKHHV